MNALIHQQRMRDRLLKFHQEQQEKKIKRCNKKILPTIDEYFLDIDIISQREKQKETVE